MVSSIRLLLCMWYLTLIAASVLIRARMAIGAPPTQKGINGQSPIFCEIRHKVQGMQNHAMITEINTNFLARSNDKSPFG